MCPTRESYKIFPAFTQPFWTWLTGKPGQGETGRRSVGVVGFTLLALVSFLCGIALAMLAVRLPGIYCMAGVLVGWTLSVCGSRMMISTVAHQCIHGRFSGRRWLDRLVAELFSVLTLTQSGEHYRTEHFLLHHRSDVFTTEADPAARFLLDVGLKPGIEVPRLWMRLLLNLVSPAFHLKFLGDRVRSNLTTGGAKRRLALVLYVLCWLLAIEGGYITWNEWLVGFAVPVLLLYQNSVLLEFISEHAWFGERNELFQPRHVHATHSWGRFCGRRVPEKQCSGLRHLLSWAGWIAEHLFYHLPVRVLVLPGDLPQHDFHHRNPGTNDWARATYAREEDSRVAEGSQWPHYQEFWGLHVAIGHVFKIMAADAHKADTAQGVSG